MTSVPGTIAQIRSELASLSGLRGIACLAILAGHAVFWLANSFNSATFYPIMDASLPMIFSFNLMEPAMEIFLFFTGYFAAISLVPALEASAKADRSLWSIVKQYWSKRAWRIIPHYYLVLITSQFLIIPVLQHNLLGPEMTKTFTTYSPWETGACEKHMWLNYLFLNNFLDVGGCVNYTWSLAVQVQFYLTFPLLLVLLQPRSTHFRMRLAVLSVAVVLVSTTFKVLVLSQISLPFPIPALGPYTAENLEALATIGHVHHIGFLPRLMNMFPGVLTALLLLNKPAKVWLHRRSKEVATTAVMLSALVSVICLFQRLGVNDPGHWLYPKWRFAVSFLLYEGLVCPAMVIATVLTLTTGESKLATAISRLLSSPWLVYVADISYDVHILNPIALLLVYIISPPSRWFSLSAPSTFYWLVNTVVYIGTALQLSSWMGQAFKLIGV